MLIDWFPDRKGLASGLVIAGFGSGALFFTPVMGALSSKFCQMPTFLGSSLEVVLEGGRQFSQVGGQLQEVVYATTSELAKLPYEGLAEGFYLVGSGSTGVAPALACIGAMYTATIVSSALMIKRPAPGYVPAGLKSRRLCKTLFKDTVTDSPFSQTPLVWDTAGTKCIVPDRTDTVPDRRDTVPDRTDIVSDRRDIVPDRRDTIPDRTEAVPGLTLNTLSQTRKYHPKQTYNMSDTISNTINIVSETTYTCLGHRSFHFWPIIVR